MATVHDVRFDAHVELDGRYAVDYPIPRKGSLDQLYDQWMLDVQMAQLQAGRRLSREELRTFVPVRAH